MATLLLHLPPDAFQSYATLICTNREKGRVRRGRHGNNRSEWCLLYWRPALNPEWRRLPSSTWLVMSSAW